MSQDSFIRNEQHYLHQESKDFIEEFPQISHFLSEPNLDPDINRTLDGFTYLSGLLNAKLEKEYPQLTSSLMNMLWPNYLQQTPSITIIEFTNLTNSSELVPEGATVSSEAQVDSTVRCPFRIARDTWVSPFKIKQTEKIAENQLEVHFHSEAPLQLSHDELNRLRIYCGLEHYSGFLLYLWLSEYVQKATLLVNGSEYALPELQFAPVGLKDKESILIYPGNTFGGYRLLHEYFCYPEGFLFFDITGIPDYFNKISTDEFSLRLEFSRSLPETLKVHDELIKTNCSPAINLFYHDCEPIRLNGQKTEYPLAISYQNSDCYELFSIDSVVGWLDNNVRYYSLFDSFHHQIEKNKGRVPLYYHVNRKQRPDSDEIQYSISFVRGDESASYDREEIISVRGLCSNNNEAQHLRLNSVCHAGEGIPSSVTLTNLTYPSKVMRPTLDGSQQWTTISSLSLNYLSLLNRESLSQILQNYNFTTLYSHRAEKTLSKLLQSITRFESEWCQQPYQDLIVEGHKSTIHISPAAFNNDGEMYLFGAVIALFYSQYAAVNSFHFLDMVNSSTNEVYQWKLMNT